MRKHTRTAAAVVVMMFASIASLVSADEASDRESLIRDIDSLLGSAASELRYAGSGSGGYVDAARGRVREVSSKLSALERVKGSDSKASDYVSRYPRYIEDFERAARQLLEMKRNQQSISELPRRCQDLDKQLQEQAQRFAQEKNGDRIEELRRLALDTGSKAEDWWREAERKRDEMRRWHGEAKNFSASDGQWSYVKDAQHGAADASLELWMRDFNQLEQACKDLRQRDRHPIVERAISELSNTAQGKAALYAQLEDRLKRAEASIRDLASDSSPSKVNDARSAINDVDGLVRQIDNIKGTDKKANHIASEWPGYVRNFASPATALVGLKEAQHQLDGVTAKCQTATRELVSALKKFVDDKDPDGLTEGPKLAEAAGDKYTRAITGMENARSTLRSLVATAGTFDARDERWAPLKRAIKDSADKMYEYWDAKTKEVHAACDDLAKGARNPAVERLLADLGGKTQSDLKDFQDLVKAWETDARGVYTLDCAGMQELWDAWCSVEFEPNDPPEASVVEQVTARRIAESEQRIDAILARLPALRTTQQKLGAKAKHRDAVAALKEELDKQEKRLQRLKRKNGDWRGNTNPAVQFTKTFGQRAHDAMAGQYRCNVYDQSGYGIRGRPDCVVVEGKGRCYVYEFKPQGWSGNNPLSGYVSAVSDYYTARMQRDEEAASNLGGAAMQRLVEANCRIDESKTKKDDRVKFEGDFRYYDRCAQRYECPAD